MGEPPPLMSENPGDRRSPTAGGQPAHPVGASGTIARRDLFWQNVLREILMTLSAAAAQNSGRLSPDAKGAAHSSSPVGAMFDGRMAIITTLGQRVPIADIFPLFSCSFRGAQDQRDLAEAVQCTVFQIRTPNGEVHTMPLSQVHSVHSLSEELVRTLQQNAIAQQAAATGDPEQPFGFAAFTSLAQEQRETTASDRNPNSNS